MEASVAGGIPIHTVLREGISGDRVTTLYGILNGTSNYILTEIEKHGSSFDDALKDAQRLGYAEADPSADVDGYDARSKLAILAALAFGEKITPSDIYTEGIRRILPLDFQYAHKLGHTIRLICGAHQTLAGLILSVRPALIPQSTILAGVQGERRLGVRFIDVLVFAVNEADVAALGSARTLRILLRGIGEIDPPGKNLFAKRLQLLFRSRSFRLRSV